ncbi:MAG: DNA-binding response regulator [Candidatus Marinimicrobia bacterium]|jgi:DNA-binding response OmpR family regulator|nr:DNA-binding response regulator [Candidatus Neomarinimicrobiota bacterium]MBR99914.1 DNA-binding response regulator [Candidatus Neomarinimicrobiota bacterium]MEC7935643.1 response regulator transcription factor [Candidatus Neomarinimicrobiota bacterium]MEC9026823.1 response regulator transcription factor [Candidatus Neomarinimicrobiota bacterium]MEC9106063.1 response regulator transcription factor [Candidatus Neomarinimicrobiota bacterium]|tara:strand:+ start:9 stop:683 length:675 start_codon:yes stop_codon:yes gene_type:complete
MKNILIVDDEPDIREILRYNLEKEGFNITEAVNGDDALDKVSKDLDLAILDIMMPGNDGYEVCRKIREQGNTVPIVFLTAMDREFDEVRGLEVGGDDYIRKPFSPRMLIARINAILRRVDQINSKGSRITFGDLEINTLTYIAKLDDNELHLPRKEFELLAFFMNQPNMIFSREELLSKIWEEDVFVVDRTIDVHINRIRSKLGIYKNWIETVKGVGYRFRPKI